MQSPFDPSALILAAIQQAIALLGQALNSLPAWAKITLGLLVALRVLSWLGGGGSQSRH